MTRSVASNPTVAEAMNSLRTQLTESISAAHGTDLVFRVEEIEVELQIALTASVSAEAKANVWTVLTGGLGAQAATTNTHRLKLKLVPRMTRDQDTVAEGPMDTQQDRGIDIARGD